MFSSTWENPEVGVGITFWVPTGQDAALVPAAAARQGPQACVRGPAHQSAGLPLAEDLAEASKSVYRHVHIQYDIYIYIYIHISTYTCSYTHTYT